MTKALATIGLASSSYYERRHPGHRRVDNPTPPQKRSSAIAYSDDEKAMIADQINAHPTLTIAQVHTHAEDTGQAVASRRTYYRVAQTTSCPTRGLVKRRSRTAKRPTVTPPMLTATTPFEVICWDVSFLPLLHRGRKVALHTAIDLYSREIVGFIIAPGPNADAARIMFDDIIAQAQADAKKIKVVHSDNGKTMKSTTLATLFDANNITRSHSRPHVSDDNPHIESVFSTLKGDLTYPGIFDDIDHATRWVTQWVEFYNTKRYHPSLAYFTPRQVRDGTWLAQWEIRQSHRLEHYRANPARYRYREPKVPKPSPEVRFNTVNTPTNHTNKTLAMQLLT